LRDHAIAGEIAVKSTIPSLDGLDRLAFREGVDIRPTLVRVLTDLYVQKSVHTAEEEHHYTELVLQLIEAVDVSTRAIVARKLATYEAAPAAIVRRLARDALEVAEPVLTHSTRLSGQELLAVIQDFGPRYAEAIAARRTPRPDAARTNLASKSPEPAVDPTSAVPAAALETANPPVPHPGPGTAVEPHHGRGPDIRLGELFFAAGSAERRAILTNLDADDVDPATRPPPAKPSEAIGRLEAAALQRRPEDFIREMESALGVEHALARRIVEDDAGEPLLVAAKSLEMASDVLLRILLFLNPVVGQSVPRVFDLASLYERITVAAASRIVASLRDTAPGIRRAVHQPMLWNDDADRGRRTAIDSARRPAGKPSVARDAPAAPGPARRQGTT
jgi:hypothetical protein